MNNDLISRSALANIIGNWFSVIDYNPNTCYPLNAALLEAGNEVVVAALEAINNAPAVAINGETSDGYHTFNELYHHRAVLFSVIVKAFPDKAWKARKHSDGSMFDGMFIVGIETPIGQATYHYDLDPYWDMFRCKEVEFAPEWDGHTATQAIERIGKLEPVRHGRWEWKDGAAYCTAHKGKTNPSLYGYGYCPLCGAKMDGESECSKG